MGTQYTSSYTGAEIDAGIGAAGSAVQSVKIGSTEKKSGTDVVLTPQAFGQGYATCSTEEATTAKVATLTDYELVLNGIVCVKFTYGVPASATLNVNSKGAKPIYHKGVAITSSTISAGDIGTFIYDGTNYNLISVDTIGDSSSKTVFFSCTLASDGWNAGTDSYTQTVAVSGLSASYEYTLASGLQSDATAEQAKAYNKAYGIVTQGTIVANAGSATFTVFKQPTTTILVYLIGKVGETPEVPQSEWTNLTTRMSAIETSDQTQNSNILALQTTTSSQGTRLTTAEEDIDDLESDLNTLTTTVTNQGTRLTTAEQTITSQGTRLTTAEGDIDTLTTTVTNQGTRLTTAEGDIDNLETLTTQHTEDIATKEKQIKYGTISLPTTSWISYSEQEISASTTITGGTVTVNKYAFLEIIYTAGTYTFTYDGTNEYWTYDSAEVDLDDYGITYTGTPEDTNTITVTLTSTAVSNCYYQIIAIPSLTTLTKVDLQPDYSVLSQMANDGTTALYIGNDEGTALAFALNAYPTVDLTVQYTTTIVQVNS